MAVMRLSIGMAAAAPSSADWQTLMSGSDAGKPRQAKPHAWRGVTTRNTPMKRLTIHLAIVLGAAALASTATARTHHSSFKGHELVGRASVSLDQARVTALKARPGQITDQELEKEKGGSGL